MGKRVDQAMQAAMFIPEEAYVDEVPVNEKDFVQGIEVRKNAPMDYAVVSTALTDSGRNYPLDLFTGTGRQKGKPDAGYTPGRVRANDVAHGIGGIRPNKAAYRAKLESEDAYFRKVRELIYDRIK